MNRPAVLLATLAVSLITLLALAGTAVADITGADATVTQDSETPTHFTIDWSMDQTDPPFGGNNVVVFAATAWEGCSGEWPFDPPQNISGLEGYQSHFGLHNDHEEGSDEFTLPKQRPLCIGVVAFSDTTTIYDAEYFYFDSPDLVDAEGWSTDTMVGYELPFKPNGLPTTYQLDYFPRGTTTNCNEPTPEDLENVESSDAGTIAHNLHDEHTVYPEAYDLAPETEYCVRINLSNAAGEFFAYYWPFTTESPRPTINSESYTGREGEIAFVVEVTPNANNSDTHLHFQYFEKVGNTCVLVPDEESYYSYPSFSPNRGSEPAVVYGSIYGLPGHTDFCVRAFAINGGGGTTPGDFFTVRTVLKNKPTKSYDYLMANPDNVSELRWVLGLQDNGASDDAGSPNSLTVDQHRIPSSQCNLEGVEGAEPFWSSDPDEWSGGASTEFNTNVVPGARGTSNCLHAHVDSPWGSDFDGDYFVHFTAGATPAFSEFEASSTANSITVSSLLDPGEFQTTVTLVHGPLGSADQCSMIDPDFLSLGSISTNLSTPQTVGTTLEGLTDHTTYCMFFFAGNALGQGSGNWQQVTTDDATAPDKPTGLALSNVTQTSATLSWDQPYDNAGVTGYNIYKEGQLLATKSSPEIDLSGACGTTDHLRVSATDEAENESELSDEFAVDYAACDVPAPPIDPTPTKTCFAPLKKKSVKAKSGKKSVTVTLSAKVASDGQSVKLSTKAKGKGKVTALTFKVDGRKVKASKGTITVKDNPALVSLSFKLGKKTKTIKVTLKKPACTG